MNDINMKGGLMEPIDTKEIIENLKAAAQERVKVIQELKEKYPIESFLTYNEFTLQDRLQFLPMKIVEYNERLNGEMAVLDNLKDQQDILIGKLYDYYRFEYDKKLTTFEIKDYYIKKDPRKIAFDKHIKKQEWVVAYFSGCTKALDKMSWTIKDYIKSLSMNI